MTNYAFAGQKLWLDKVKVVITLIRLSARADPVLSRCLSLATSLTLLAARHNYHGATTYTCDMIANH
jgi:hypothetical protein